MMRSAISTLLMALAIAPAAHAQGASAAGATATETVPQRLSLAELRKRYQKPGDRYIDVGGVELRYRDEGKGPVLLLLHGSRSTLNAWDGVTARLKDRYRIIRYDFAPTGLSGPVSDAALKAIGAPENVPLGILDKLGVDKAIVVGVSSGGTLGYYLAAAHPERVSALVLSNTPSDPVPNLKVELTPALQAAVDKFKRTGVEGIDFWTEYLRGLYGEPARVKPGLAEYYYTINLRQKEPNQLSLLALTANNEKTMANLRAVKAPTLILWGMRDHVLKPENGQALYGYLTGAKSRSFVALDDVGHYPPMESPERIADLIDTYLRDGLNLFKAAK
ncbi:alpha/beta hydrolase [Sphingobium sp. CR2-8]|uniref:alpha/beta fold hydrolase n=1 Tax=Sphingobium sp. CR2-8 TaxID=1306534 RepID=UPI002DB699CB|nr:alpha/beta hydrolase [Sphingobium sp. CR2-8]MEC3911472.1 alpha/beta hydrolase [Sphingobium sp. CR2-8]